MKIRLTSTLCVPALCAAFASPALANSGASSNVAPETLSVSGSGIVAVSSSSAPLPISEEAAPNEADQAQTPASAPPAETSSLTADAMLANAAKLRGTPVQYGNPQADTASQLTQVSLSSAPSPSAEQLLALAANMSAEELAAVQTVLASAQYSGGEPAGDERSDSFAVLLSQDSFFGFYPSFNGLIPIGDNLDFSFYGILWTTDAFGTGLGSDLWTEFGVGLNFITADGNLSIKPQIGLTNGALLSGGVRDDVTDLPTNTGGNFADGIVPSLTMVYSDDSFEAEFYGGYYAALRNRNDPGASDFLHTWINGGAKVTDKFSVGAHYELLSLTRFVGGDDAVVYQWLGPYVQFTTDNGFFARFTAGADIEEGNDGDFYKLTAGFSF